MQMQVDDRTQVNIVPLGIRSVRIRGQVRQLIGPLEPSTWRGASVCPAVCAGPHGG